MAAGGGGSLLELGTGTTTGSLTGFGSRFTGFGTIDVDTGASWKVDTSGSPGASVTIIDNGTLTNSGTLQNTYVTVTSGATLDNQGTITGTTPVLLLGGVLINESVASVGNFSAVYGVGGKTSRATVSNAWAPSAALSSGATFAAGGLKSTIAQCALLVGTIGVGAWHIGGGVGTVTNAGVVPRQERWRGAPRRRVHQQCVGSAWITGTSHSGAYILGGVGTITNAGTIKGANGVALFAGGAVVNQAGGLLTASGNDGVYVTGGAGTVTNAGTIAGAVDAVQFIGGFTNRLIDVPGAVFSGAVAGGSGSNTLELAAGTSAAGDRHAERL